MGPGRRGFIFTARLYPSDSESWPRLGAGQASIIRLLPGRALGPVRQWHWLSRISIGKTPQDVLLLSSNAIPGRPPYITHVLMRSKGREKCGPFRALSSPLPLPRHTN